MNSRHLQSPSLLALCAFLSLCTACASRLPPLHTSGLSFTLASDEALIWERAAYEHRKLSRSASVLRDPLLDDYLTDVARRLVPPAARDAGVLVSVHVLMNPSLNAFAYPTGAIYVHSGLLAQLENEAQLAAILAHEIGHVIHRHTIRHLREERHKDLWTRIALVTTPLALGPLLAPLGISVGGGVNPAILLQRPSIEDFLEAEALDTFLAFMALPTPAGRRHPATAWYTRTQPPLALTASVRHYPRALLEEADRFAVEALARAGYDPREVERSRLLLQGMASAQGTQEPFWWGRPQASAMRQAWIRKALAGLSSAVNGSQPPAHHNTRFQQHMRRLVRENAAAELNIGRPAAAMAQLHRVLQWHPDDPVALYYLGKAYTASASGPNELRQALAAYTQATQVDSTFADAYRALAFLHARLDELEQSAAAQEAYVTLRGEQARAHFSVLQTLTLHGVPSRTAVSLP
jgi:predicted Zn-dependent protease